MTLHPEFARTRCGENHLFFLPGQFHHPFKGAIVMTNWTQDNIPDLNGKVFIVTGANSGVGYESSLALAAKGATVVMACRSLERGQRAREAIQRALPSAKLEVMPLDLASLKSIHAFAKTFKSKYDRLDVLINNGGPVGAARGVTEDGFESHFGINHLGHFALTGLLLDVLLNTPSSRIVTLSSRMHTTGKIQWDDLMSEHSYDRFNAYRQSKLANLLFTFELNRRLEAKGTTTRAIAAHPGQAATGWAENNFDGLMGFLLKTMSNVKYQSAAMGALPPLYAAVDLNAQPGGYYGPERDTRGYPVQVRAADPAYNETDAKRLWELSEKLTGVKYDALKL
jgi:NAD(P)-dependent dehydrogenase (short-subunit alcohol dehydrogenase family)